MTDEQRGGLVIGALIVLGIIGWNVFTSISETISPSCYSLITKCKDNADVVNNYGRMQKATSACVRMANGMANFGTPEWTSVPFGMFSRGDDFPARNAVVLFDNDVMFSNGFGAKQRTPLRCDYDFGSGTAVVVGK